MKVVLVYAECVATGKGDYVFAAGMARDLKRAMCLNEEWHDTEILLTSSKRGVECFQSLYATDNGLLCVDDVSLGVIELGAFDPVNNQVRAFINAHRCKYPEANLLKRVLEPDSKILFLGNANRMPRKMSEVMRKYAQQQPGIYGFFYPEQLYLGSVGFGETRLGLGFFEQALVPEIAQPQQEYGFLYLKLMPGVDAMMAQYVALTQSPHYHLVGNFLGAEHWFPKHCTITTHKTLAHDVMLKHMREASANMVAVTGVASTLEAMRMGKLPFYQDYPDSENKPFVANYLQVLNTHLVQYAPDIADKLTLLAGLLFAPKPLSEKDFDLLRNFVDKKASESNKAMVSSLVELNKTMMAREHGRYIPTILQFIAEPTKSRISEQSFLVCDKLTRTGSRCMLTAKEAMFESVKSGLLFELKVLVALFSQSREPDKPAFYATLLLLAESCKQLDCVRYLSKCNASSAQQGQSGQDLSGENACTRFESLSQNSFS